MKFFLLLISMLITFNSYAHQPKLINYAPSINNPHEIIYPEISKAYYGKLKGEPHYYKIESESEFSFYAGISTPKVNDNYKWLSIDVLDENNNLIGNYIFETRNIEWITFQEMMKHTEKL